MSRAVLSLGANLGDRAAALRPAVERDAATTALTTWLALRQPPVWGVRVHDAAASVDAVRTVAAVRAARSHGDRRG